MAIGFMFGGGLIILVLTITFVVAFSEVRSGRAVLGESEKQELEKKNAVAPPNIPDPADPSYGIHKDALWGMFEKHLDTAQHHEEQRERVTGLLLVLEVATVGLLAFKEGQPQVTNPIYLTVPLVIMGLFGALFSLKHYERYRFHTAVAGSYRRKMDEFVPAAELGKIFLETKKTHEKRYERISKIHLFYYWTALHIGVACFGLFLTFAIPISINTSTKKATVHLPTRNSAFVVRDPASISGRIISDSVVVPSP